MTMTNEQKERLKNIPVKRCFVCNTPKSYGNPMAKCGQCKNNYCYDHIWGGQYLEGDEECKDICDKCKTEFKYKNL